MPSLNQLGSRATKIIGVLAAMTLIVGLISLRGKWIINEPLPDDEYIRRVQATDWNWTPKEAAKESNVFIGIAVSGGGSRAAVFGAAALKTLNEVGILKYVTAISGVSGGSLPVAYFALFRDRPMFWETIVDHMATDFVWEGLKKLALPHHFLGYLMTPLDRSDLMAEVFDEHLFEHRLFRDLVISSPRIFISATRAESGDAFKFTDFDFFMMGSRLDTVPISHGVMASAAYPGLLNSVTFRDYRDESSSFNSAPVKARQLVEKILSGKDPVSSYIRGKLSEEDIKTLRLAASSERDSYHALEKFVLSGLSHDDLFYNEKRFKDVQLSNLTREELAKGGHLPDKRNRLLFRDAYASEVGEPPLRYAHVIDGGVHDNTGLSALVTSARAFASEKNTVECLLIAIDSFIEPYPRPSYSLDPRHWYDLLIDTNAITAAEIMFGYRRDAMFKKLGMDLSKGVESDELYEVKLSTLGDTSRPFKCLVWHINFERLSDYVQLSYKGIPDIGSGATSSQERSSGQEDYGYFHAAIHSLVTNTDTSFRLRGGKCSPDELKNALLDASHILIMDDNELTSKVHNWFRRHNLSTLSDANKKPLYRQVNTSCLPVERGRAMRYLDD